MPEVVLADTKPTHLEEALYHSIRYFSFSSLPVTPTQMWRSLVLPATNEDTTRWGGHQLYSLHEVWDALHTSKWLQQRISTKWGYYFLNELPESSVPQRLARHALAQQKWKILDRITRFLIYVPFVKMMAVSGSLSFGNARPSSDLDLFIVVEQGRIWTARALLLLVTQLLGRRRKYWDQKAPDKVCLNHYVTDSALSMPTELRNLYTAMIFTYLVPIYGLALHQEFMNSNETWFKRFIMYPPAVALPSAHALHLFSFFAKVKRGLEAILREPVGNALEHLLRTIQQRTIQKHTVPGRPGRVVISETELAFHPDTKMDHILALFEQDLGQKSLL